GMSRWRAGGPAEGLHGSAVSPLDAVGINGSGSEARLAGAQGEGERLTRDAYRERGAGNAGRHGHHGDASFRSADAGVDRVGRGNRLAAGGIQSRGKRMDAAIGADESVV